MVGLQKSLGYDKIITVEPVGLSGGLALMWKDSYKVDVLSSDKRIIYVKVKMASISFFLTCVYGDPVKERRQDVCDHLTDIGLIREEAWLLAGLEKVVKECWGPDMIFRVALWTELTDADEVF
ncbi:hypothetical protein F2Q69_00017410 [Brassica cretica]|uniref:Uncharacterized protein n=1 Tax=Brassica cretica TaxID=69181 RepID=A0A8S9QXI4_BRACR|nr:hypothetical protein F2Q69_00017410 [Brassica cretica]